MMGDGARGCFVEATGVRLHCLEWGDGGDPLVLLPGLGQSAHVFGELAPRLAAGFRVVAITPRGHGESSTPADGYTLEASADDLREGLDALGVEEAVLVAHSFSGAAATRFAAHHPGRVRGIVYLDALHDYDTLGEVMARNPFPPPPRPDFADRDATRAWMTRYVPGFWCDALEADLRAHAASEAAAWRWELLVGLVDDAGLHPPPYEALRCPVLALSAAETVETQFGWMQPMAPADRERAEAYLRTVREPWRRASEARFLAGAPEARLERVDGGHYFFLTAGGEVADRIRGFASSLSPSDT